VAAWAACSIDGRVKAGLPWGREALVGRIGSPATLGGTLLIPLIVFEESVSVPARRGVTRLVPQHRLESAVIIRVKFEATAKTNGFVARALQSDFRAADIDNSSRIGDLRIRRRRGGRYPVRASAAMAGIISFMTTAFAARHFRVTVSITKPGEFPMHSAPAFSVDMVRAVYGAQQPIEFSSFRGMISRILMYADSDNQFAACCSLHLAGDKPNSRLKARLNASSDS
jgi:hypothetical protein